MLSTQALTATLKKTNTLQETTTTQDKGNTTQRGTTTEQGTTTMNQVNIGTTTTQDTTIIQTTTVKDTATDKEIKTTTSDRETTTTDRETTANDRETAANDTVIITNDRETTTIVRERTTYQEEEEFTTHENDRSTDQTVGRCKPNTVLQSIVKYCFNEKYSTFPEWHKHQIDRKLGILNGDHNTTQSNVTVPDILRIVMPLVPFLQQSQPPDISQEKKEWFKKLVEAKAAEVVGAWFAFLIAGEIVLFIVLDINLVHEQGKVL